MILLDSIIKNLSVFSQRKPLEITKKRPLVRRVNLYGSSDRDKGEQDQ